MIMDLQEVVTYSLIGAALYPLLTSTVNTVSMILSQKIQSQQSLDFEIQKEQQKLGLQDVRIEGKLTQVTRGRFYHLNDHYVIEIGGFCANTSTVRHEMNHIRRIEEGRSKLVSFDLSRDPQLSDVPRILCYFYSTEELSSILYEAFRIKI
ncbi:MAG: hypothetical protein ABIH82_04835 [Candidatus Woesearchaeota archaeon]